MIALRCWLALIGLTNLGCASSLCMHRDSAIQEAISRDERRAAELWAKSFRLSRLLDVQHRCLAVTQCHAEEAKFDAQRMDLVAACNAEQANWHACEAHAAKGKAESTAGGCLMGWIVAVATGGSAAPLTLLGCGVGNMAGGTDPAPMCADHAQRQQPAACGSRQAEFESEALQRANLDARPSCSPEPAECAEIAAMMQSL